MTFHSLQMVQNAAPSLASRALLRGVRLSIWEGFKFDAGTTDELNRSKGAESDASRLNIRLIPKEALVKVKSAANAIRILHGTLTLPWTDNGLDILAAAMVQRYDSEMRDLRIKFESAVEDFLYAYPSYVANAPQRLGDLYRYEDFPSVDELRGKFSFRIRSLPMPDAQDFRVDMSEAQARQIREEIAEESRAALETAMRSAFERVSDVCSRMVDRLNAYQPPTMKGEKAVGVFRDSLVENVRDLVALLPAFNLSNDPALAAITRRMDDGLCRHSADALRDDSSLRQEVASEAQAILDDVSAFLA